MSEQQFAEQATSTLYSLQLVQVALLGLILGVLVIFAMFVWRP